MCQEDFFYYKIGKQNVRRREYFHIFKHHIYPPGANDEARRQKRQFDQSVFSNEASTMSFHVQLQNQRAPPRSDREERIVKEWWWINWFCNTTNKLPPFRTLEALCSLISQRDDNSVPFVNGTNLHATKIELQWILTYFPLKKMTQVWRKKRRCLLTSVRPSWLRAAGCCWCDGIWGSCLRSSGRSQTTRRSTLGSAAAWSPVPNDHAPSAPSSHSGSWKKKKTQHIQFFLEARNILYWKLLLEC